MATKVVPETGRGGPVPRPGSLGRQVRRALGALLALVLAGIALGLPPLTPPPAAAAPSDVILTLTQSSAGSAIGTEVTLTATLSNPTGPLPELTGGWLVAFSGNRNGEWSSGPIRAVNGVATYRISRAVATTETITARVVNPDCIATGMTKSVTHEWWLPEIILDEGDSDASDPAGTTFTLSGTVRRSGDPLASTAVEVVITDETGDADEGTEEVTTNADGAFSVSWTKATPSIERVAITATGANGFNANLVTSHAWSAEDADDSLTLSADDDQPRLGEPVSVTAELFDDLSPVDFWAEESWVESFTQTPFEYTSPEAVGWQILGARSTDGHYRGLSVRWSQPTITFVAPDRSTVGDGPHTVAVIASDQGQPLPYTWLEFRISGESEPSYVLTDLDGMAQVGIEGEPGDSKTIQVTEDLDEEGPDDVAPATASTTHRWVNPTSGDLNITLTAQQESRVGAAVPFVARVTDADDNPVPNSPVAFNLEWDDLLGTAVTDAAGNARFTISRTSEDSFWIRAVVAAGCTEHWALAHHYWWETQLDLTPKAATSTVRGHVIFSAEVARTVDQSSSGGIDQAAELRAESKPPDSAPPDDALPRSPQPARPTAEMRGPVTAAAIPEGMIPLTGQLVRFTLSNPRCELPVAVREARTNNRGIAQVAMTRNGPGTDIVRAQEVGVSLPASDTTTHRWAPARPVPQSITLTQSSKRSRVGAPVTVTATVHDTDRPNGRAPAGTRVSFLGTDPGRTVRTDKNGVAELTFTSKSTNPSDISATVRYGCGVVVAPTIRHRWFVPESEPSSSPTPSVVTESPVTEPPVVITSEPPIIDEPTPEESEPTEEPSPEPTPEPTEEPTPDPTDDLPATSTMVDGPEVGRPGGDIQLSGTGCKAGEQVTVNLGDKELGTTRAAADGTFYLRSGVPDLQLGRYVIHSSCGTTIGDPNVDITAPQVDRAGGALATAGLTTGSILVFFVLVAKGVISFLPRRPY